jgi:hypothetical protein
MTSSQKMAALFMNPTTTTARLTHPSVPQLSLQQRHLRLSLQQRHLLWLQLALKGHSRRSANKMASKTVVLSDFCVAVTPVLAPALMMEKVGKVTAPVVENLEKGTTVAKAIVATRSSAQQHGPLKILLYVLSSITIPNRKNSAADRNHLHSVSFSVAAEAVARRRSYI